MTEKHFVAIWLTVIRLYGKVIQNNTYYSSGGNGNEMESCTKEIPLFVKCVSAPCVYHSAAYCKGGETKRKTVLNFCLVYWHNPQQQIWLERYMLL